MAMDSSPKTHTPVGILVTGASGMVGSALLDSLASDGRYKLYATQHKSKISTNASLNVIQSSEDSLVPNESVLKEIDLIIHCAARVHVMKERVEDVYSEFHKANVVKTLQLAEMAAKAGIKRFVFLSSIKVNGESTPDNGMAFTEEDDPAPSDPYSLSKLEAELGLLEISSRTNMEVTIIRPPLVYGPGVKANFAQLVRMVKSGLPLPLANINNSRSFIFVGNLTDAIIKSMDHPKAAGQTFFVSDGHDMSTPELIAAIAQAAKCKNNNIGFPLRLLRALLTLVGKKTSIDRLAESLKISTLKIRQQLSWVPPFTPEQGIEHTVEWLSSKPSAKIK
jgi:nucleoside-diphosphate-sugar epimerase